MIATTTLKDLATNARKTEWLADYFAQQSRGGTCRACIDDEVIIYLLRQPETEQRIRMYYDLTLRDISINTLGYYDLAIAPHSLLFPYFFRVFQKTSMHLLSNPSTFPLGEFYCGYSEDEKRNFQITYSPSTS